LPALDSVTWFGTENYIPLRRAGWNRNQRAAAWRAFRGISLWKTTAAKIAQLQQ